MECVTGGPNVDFRLCRDHLSQTLTLRAEGSRPEKQNGTHGQELCPMFTQTEAEIRCGPKRHDVGDGNFLLLFCDEETEVRG